ncbi:signal peptidase II [Camelimonas sp. ID_303_24]
MAAGDGQADASGKAQGRAGVSPVRLGVWLAIVVLALDQASKLWLMFGADIANRPPMVLTPFLEFVLVWNRGISYGLFQMPHAVGRWALVIGSALATVLLGVWLARARTRMLALGLGLIIGGAVGNLIDRIYWGAVVDFVHFHVGDFSWYVFNVADAAIVFGVIALLYDSFFGSDAGRKGADSP